MRKRIIAMFLSVIMILAGMPASIYADDLAGSSAASDDTLEEIASQVQDPYNDPFDYISPKASLKSRSASSYGEKLDLRDPGLVTPVKFQNPFGTCWGFAAIAAAETSILGNPEVRGDYTADTLDLSEKHLVYFVAQEITDPDDPQYGEGTHADKGVTVADRLNNGGMTFLATNLFASGVGPVVEDDGTEEPTLKYMGSDRSVEFATVGDHLEPYCYDDEDDWSLPEEYRKLQTFVLKESYILPSPAHTNQDTGEYEYNPAGTEAIKEMLSENRAVQIGFCADTSSPSQEAGDGQYISTNWAHYTYDANESANHAVTIVGWDDNYPKENFIKGHRPPENGAWLVKNSWGSEEEEFPYKGPGWGIENENGEHTGYFWLSYYDKTLNSPEALEFDRNNESENEGYYVDAHDFMPPNDVEGANVDKETKMANVFKARECQLLEGVSCQTSFPGTRVLNEIYLLPDGFEDPTDGILVGTATGEYKYGGFHKQQLDSPVLIQKGQYYSIVQTQTVGDKYAVNMPVAMNEIFSKAMGCNTWVKGVVNKKESYMYSDGKWNDYSDKTFIKKIYGDLQNVMTYDNFPIKGYCRLQPDISIRVYGDTKLDLFNNSRSVLRLSFKGHDSYKVKPESTTWKLSDGSSDIFKITPDPANPTRATVTALNVGKAKLYVTVEGAGTTVIPLSVNKIELYEYTVFSESHVYNGKPLVPDFVVTDPAEGVVDKQHYTIKGINNIKCGKAKIKVTAKPDDEIYTGEQEIEFFISPARSVITGLSDGNKSLTVTVRDQKASGVKAYIVSYRAAGTTAWKTKVFSSDSNKLVLKGLTNGKKYQVKVRAREAFHEDLEFDNVGKYSIIKTSGKIGARPAKPVSIANAKVVLSASSFAYNGKVRKPSIKTINGKALKSGTDYTVKWSNTSSKNVGSYTVTITGKGNYTGTTKATYKINPKGTSLKKPKKAKKAITVKWKKQAAKMSKSRITGYQIQLATDKQFTKNKKTVTVKGYKKVSKKVKKLKGGKKYYVKIRTYKTIKGKKYYSKWSKVKTIKTKK